MNSLNTDLYSAVDRERLTSTVEGLSQFDSEPIRINGGVATAHHLGSAVADGRMKRNARRQWGDVQQRKLHDIDLLFRSSAPVEHLLRNSNGRFTYVSHNARSNGQNIRAQLADNVTQLQIDIILTHEHNYAVDSVAPLRIGKSEVMVESAEGMLVEVAGYALRRLLAGSLHPKRLRDLHLLAEIVDMAAADDLLLNRFRLSRPLQLIQHLDDYVATHPEILADATWESEFDRSSPPLTPKGPALDFEHSLAIYPSRMSDS